MVLHEKTLEANLTHELLNLADSWYWFLTDIPLWRYWRPRFRLPFLHQRSIAFGFHSSVEGVNDPTGAAGGGYDMAIKHGRDKHLLFIQYKRGEERKNSPSDDSIFATAPHEHMIFKLNSTNTNQHFMLRDLANAVGAKNGNAVVYAFPMIADIADLEKHAGRLVRKTKFISIADIDKQAAEEKKPFKKDEAHAFRICRQDINRCELNWWYAEYTGEDRAKDVIADIIALNFQKTLNDYVKEIAKNYKQYSLDTGYIDIGIQRAFGQYIRYLLHYFEVSPVKISGNIAGSYYDYLQKDERDLDYLEYKSTARDVEIITAILSALQPFKNFIDDPIVRVSDKEFEFKREIPMYTPLYFISLNSNGINISLDGSYDRAEIEQLSYMLV